MNSEIEVGEYIRSIKGIIGKVCAFQELRTYTDENSVSFYSYDTDKGAISDCEVVKHSSNLIDLIEVGDYVNGQYIVEKFYDYANKEWNIVTALKEYLKFGKSRNDIKKVATKEQFKSIEYEV